MQGTNAIHDKPAMAMIWRCKSCNLAHTPRCEMRGSFIGLDSAENTRFKGHRTTTSCAHCIYGKRSMQCAAFGYIREGAVWHTMLLLSGTRCAVEIALTYVYIIENGGI